MSAEPRPGPQPQSGSLVAVAVDIVCVLVFVVIGRNTHDSGGAVTGALETAAPFLIALVPGWLAAYRLGLSRVIAGLVVWPVTVAVGMALRHLVFDRGTATPFVVVASLFLALTLVGWRAIAGVLTGRRRVAQAG